MNFQTTLTDAVANHYKQDGWWVDKTILEHFDAAVATSPAATALVAPGRRMF